MVHFININLINNRERFGLHLVDFDDPDIPRIPKESSKYFKQIVENNGFIQ